MIAPRSLPAMKIFSDVKLDAESAALLHAGLAPHELIVSKYLSASSRIFTAISLSRRSVIA